MPSPTVVFESASGDEVHDAKRARPVRRERIVRPPTTPTRIEMPHQPATPAQFDTLVQPERPVQPSRPADPERRLKPGKPIRVEIPGAPAHVDEVGKRVDVRESCCN